MQERMQEGMQDVFAVSHATTHLACFDLLLEWPTVWSVLSVNTTFIRVSG